MTTKPTIQQVANAIGAEWLLLQYIAPHTIGADWFHFWRDWFAGGAKEDQ